MLSKAQKEEGRFKPITYRSLHLNPNLNYEAKI